MDKYDLLEAMSGIRDEYIEEAAGTALKTTSAVTSETASAASSYESGSRRTETAKMQSGQSEVPARGTVREEPAVASGNKKKAEKLCRPAASRRHWLLRMEHLAAGAAAVLFLSILLPNVSPGAASAFQRLPLVGNYFRAVTFRSYQYADSASDAYVEEPAVVTMSSGDVRVEDSEASAALESVPEEQKGIAAGAAEESALSEESLEDEAADRDLFDAGSAADAAVKSSSVQAALSAARITEEIRQRAYDQISAFEESLAEETGYRSLRFLHETVTDTDKWFCLEIYAYTSAADGFEEVTHYNIDKETGELVTLETYFGEEKDYITPISENIRGQMRARMKADPEVEYWIDSEEEPEYDFTQISPDQDCYFNTDGNLVICFNEGEAAPMYMGTVEFTIPQEVVNSIRP